MTVALNSGLFKSTQEGAQATKEKSEQEQEVSDGWVNIDGERVNINSFTTIDGGWTYNHSAQTVSKGTKTLNIGDYVDYKTPSNIDYSKLGDDDYFYDAGWRIFGVDNSGRLLLVSEKVVTQIDYFASYLTTFRGTDYNTAVQTLNNMCAPFADGKIAISARSIKVSDINTLTGYNPNNTGANSKFDEGLMREYLNKVTITKSSTGYTFTGQNGQTATASQFKNLGDSGDLTSSIDITSNYYSYYLDTLTSTKPESYNTDGVLYDLIIKAGDSSNLEYPYWLADQYQEIRTDGKARWGIRCVSRSMSASGDGQRILGAYLWDSVSRSA